MPSDPAADLWAAVALMRALNRAGYAGYSEKEIMGRIGVDAALIREFDDVEEVIGSATLTKGMTSRLLQRIKGKAKFAGINVSAVEMMDPYIPPSENRPRSSAPRLPAPEVAPSDAPTNPDQDYPYHQDTSQVWRPELVDAIAMQRPSFRKEPDNWDPRRNLDDINNAAAFAAEYGLFTQGKAAPTASHARHERFLRAVDALKENQNSKEALDEVVQAIRELSSE